uniref:Uncharacterized protein n=1 Tax=Arundo donax TaxID=35708 RepID=A0A0A8YGQ2_ARUDO
MCRTHLIFARFNTMRSSTATDHSNQQDASGSSRANAELGACGGALPRGAADPAARLSRICARGGRGGGDGGWALPAVGSRGSGDAARCALGFRRVSGGRLRRRRGGKARRRRGGGGVWCEMR